MKIIIATNNQGKVDEFKRILTPLGLQPYSLKEMKIKADPEENGTTFAENSAIKANYVKNLCSLPVIADDSGLCVDYLNGAPGIYSARFASECEDFNKDNNLANNKKLLNLLKDVPTEKRGAKFVCSICCIFPNGDKICANGQVCGTIDTIPQGTHGFGYDPLFIYTDENGVSKSFGLMTAQEKDAVSHRARALEEFADKLKQYFANNKL